MYTLFILSLLFHSIPGQHYGSLWCHQGSDTEYSPAQCEEQTLDCFRLSCDHEESSFVARGCGVSLGRTATGLVNESCHQAMEQCQLLGGNPTCFTCSDLHMCNHQSFVFYPISLILVFVLIVA